MADTRERFSPVAPTPDDVVVARAASKRLDSLLARAAKKARGKAIDRANTSVVGFAADVQGAAGKSERIPLPASAVRLVMDILHEMAQGNAVAVLPYGDELSTEEAARILNVSRPFVSKLVDESKLPARKVGRHRRIRL